MRGKSSSRQLWFFYPKLAKCFGLQTDFRSLSKKPENAKTFIPTFKFQVRQTRWWFSSSVRNHFFWKCKNENWNISSKNFFFSKQSSVPVGSSFDNRFKKMSKNTMFFWWKLEETFKKMFRSLNKDFFWNVPMYTLIVVWTPRLKSFCLRFRISQKIKEKFKIRMTFFTQIFHFVYYKLAVERKREKILLEYLRQCEKMHFKTIDCDGIALNWFFKTFFLHVVKVCEKEVFHFRKLKDLKNCLFAKTYAPNFLKNQLQQNLTAQKTTVVSGYFFDFASMFEHAPKVISTEAAFFTKRLGFAFTVQTDVQSRWGEELRN